MDLIMFYYRLHTFLVKYRSNHFNDVDSVQVVEASLRGSADVRKTGSTIDEASGARLSPDVTAKPNLMPVNRTATELLHISII